MITINIWGNCMTRDIVTPLTVKNKIKVLQYVGGGTSHPISAFSDKGKRNISINDLENYAGSNFEKRIFCQDVNKTALEYLVAKKSDYLLIDLLSVRLNMYKQLNHYLVCGYPYVLNKEKIHTDFNLDSYELVTPYDISLDIWNNYTKKFCDFISKYYSPNQIILHKCLGATEYVDNEKRPLKSFNSQIVSDVNNYNSLVQKVNAFFLEQISGCHVINFCNNVIGDKANVLGLHPLHYEKSYYDYGAQAIETICMNHSEKLEIEILNDLNVQYSERFALLHEKLCLQNNLFWANNALNFAKKLHFDIFGQENFIQWLKEQKSKRTKLSVLVSQNVAGQILLKALNKYDIKPIFVSSEITFEALSNDEFELCRLSDIVIFADVHRIYPPPPREGVQGILIMDLLENK